MEKRAKAQTFSITDFLEQAQRVHGSKYSYDKFEYINSKTKGIIICPDHGPFLQMPNSHLNGRGCPKCIENQLLTQKEFIKRAQNIHGTKYDYSKFVYMGAYTKSTIICPDHGPFLQVSHTHLRGHGCPECKTSRGERDTKLVLEKRFGITNIITQKRFDDCRDRLPLPFDISLFDYNILIEYHGKQHYVVVELFGGQEGLEIRQKHDQIKMDYAKDHNIKLIIIPYTIKTQKNIESYLQQELGPPIPTPNSFLSSWAA
jgi:ssDNA-binding Zn-finger/Zn-ribbon topoisomerase 1